MTEAGRKTVSAGPLTIEEATALFAPLRAAPRLVLGVSGGPDSIALMHLALLVSRAGLLPQIVVATVDHGLQPASRAVAAEVIEQSRGLGLESHLLVWDGPKPSTGLQEAARLERYRLLGGLARRLRATHLLTAHTLDDQAETILFRMARGSGPAGLVGMRRAVTREGVIQHRPFLGVEKRRLVDTCVARGWRFVEDPANRNVRFARTRLRILMPSLAGEGLDAQTFATLARRLSRDEEALGALARTLVDAIRTPGAEGGQRLEVSMLLAQPDAVVIRALETVMTDFARSGPPRLGRLEDLLNEIRQAHAAGRNLRRTLHGNVVTLERAGFIDIRPEKPRKRGLDAAKL